MHTSYSLYTLPNKMRAILAPVKGTDAVSLFVYCKVGSRFETPKINGASHFIEHLMFKGTKRRPTTLEISQEIESLGAQNNAATSKDYTCYYIKLDGKHFAKAVDILHDMLTGSLFDPVEMERERKVIIEEIKMYEENPLMHIEDLYEQAMFAGSPLGWSIAGPAKTIANMKRSDLIAYRDRVYLPANMLVVAAGKLPKNAHALIAKYFGSMSSPQKKLPTFKRGIARKGSVLVQQRKVEQSQIALGFPGLSNTDPRNPILDLMTVILGGSMSSRLFIQVRERKGLCYHIHSASTSYVDTGTVVIQAGVSSTRVKEAIKEILKVTDSLRKAPVSDAELQRAKEYVRGRTVLAMEGSDHIAQWFGSEALWMKKIRKPEDRLKELDRVTKAQIQKMANLILRPEAISAAGVGPFSQKEFASLFSSSKG